jgi:hypothetical protein
MLAWEPIPDEKPNAESERTPLLAGVLYRLTLAVPSWAGALMALYSISLLRLGAHRIRLR